jgi:PAS domain S-box-containing protein
MEQRSNEQLVAEIKSLQAQLNEANETLDAIRTGQVDALVVSGENGHALFTLKTADHSYRVFIEQMSEGAVTLNSSGLIIYSNTQFASMVGAPLSDVLGGDFFTFIRNTESFDRLFQAGWTGNVKGECFVISGTRDVPALLSLNRLQLEGEVALSVIVTDLTSQKETERLLTEKNQQLESLNEALISSNHDLQQFASIASHDLQEPLRKIQVFSNFLRERANHELSEQSMQYLDKILLASHRMKVLIIDILTYSRLSADNNKVEEISLRALIDEILEDFDLKVVEDNATIEISDLPTIEGNKGQLRQVFYNLISNALKFIPKDRNPHIIISSKPIDAKALGVSLMNEDDYCRIAVSDNGIGFDDRFSTAIFSLFEKLNPKSSFEGSGIGLAIAKKVVDKHHGLIVAKSVVGIGSEFNVILPYKRHSSPE